ncbi:MAG: sulfatase-like hydrolase/transferase [Bryobacterales bacterium]|nr:sulfatase-like hydrolase/transferase [Bryobacterales bacterium]
MALAAVILASACPWGPAPGDPHIVPILADDLVYGDLGSCGATRVRTPNIDRWATGEVPFTDASTCTGARYGLLTGRYSRRT